MGKFAVLIFVVFIVALAFLAMYNKDSTTVTIPFYETYEMSKMALMLVSGGVGALIVLFVFIVRDTKRLVATYQFQKKQKKEEKLHGLYSRAMNAMLANDLAEAKELLEDIIRDDSEHFKALLRLGDLAAMEEHLEEALKHYKKALSASPPGSLEALFSLSRLFQRLGRWPEALEYVEEILDKDPGNLGALHLKRLVLERTSKWDDLIDVQKSIMKAAQKAGHDAKKEETALAGYRYEQARESLEQGQVERAGKGFRSILRADEGFVPAYLGAAEAMLRDGDSEGAVDFLEKGYEATRSPIILARIEDVLIGIGEPSRLLKTYRNALAANSQDPMLRFFLGKLYYRLEMVDDALDTLGAGEVPEGFPQWNQLLGELYLRRNQCMRAVEEFKKTIDFRRTLRLPYCCSDCGHADEDWSGRCPSCGRWSTYEFNLHGACKA